MEEKTKIYFAGAVSGGRQLETHYAELIRFLNTKATVLTENVGKKEIFELEVAFSPEQVLNQYLERLIQSDAVIADVTVPSLGVGYEIAFAEKLGKKTVCLYHSRAQTRLSAMVTGNKNLTIIYYDSVEQAKQKLEEIWHEIEKPKKQG